VIRLRSKSVPRQRYKGSLLPDSKKTSSTAVVPFEPEVKWGPLAVSAAIVPAPTIEYFSYPVSFSEPEEPTYVEYSKAFATNISSSVASSFLYDTIINATSDRRAHGFWTTVANSIFQQSEDIHITSNWTTVRGEQRANSVSRVIWATMLLRVVADHIAQQSEQQDILEVIEHSLPGQYSQNKISPSTLLRACAVGASISEEFSERPHIYSAPGGRVVLDYAMFDGRFTAIFAEDYVHFLGPVRGKMKDKIFEQQQFNLLEFKNWMSSQ
jgi:hypothetical protein